MKVELHLHTSRYSGCSRCTPAEMMERLIELGYEAVYITEHDAVWSRSEIAQLQAAFPRIRVFPGLERSLGEEAFLHILVLGATDPGFMRLHRPADVLKKAQDQGHLTVLAHPFRWGGGEEILQAGHLPDALEYRTGNHDARCAALAEQAARKFGLPLVNAADAHGLDFLDRFWVQTDGAIGAAADIRRIVLAGAYRNCVGEGGQG